MPTFLSQKAKQRSTRMCQILSISGCISAEVKLVNKRTNIFDMFNAIFVVLIAAAGALAQPRFEDVTDEAIPFRLFEAEGMALVTTTTTDGPTFSSRSSSTTYGTAAIGSRCSTMMATAALSAMPHSYPTACLISTPKQSLEKLSGRARSATTTGRRFGYLSSPGSLLAASPR